MKMTILLKILPDSYIIGKTLSQIEKEYSVTIPKLTLYKDNCIHATNTKKEPQLKIPANSYIEATGEFENIKKLSLDSVKWVK